MLVKDYNQENKQVLRKLMLNLNDPIRESWISYIRNSKTDKNPLSQPNLYRLSLTNKMYELEQEGRTLFHMSVTYKPYSNRIYTEKDINTFFINFYTKKLLPFLMNTRNYHTKTKKQLQPVSYCFVDEHEMNPVKLLGFNTNRNQVEETFMFPTRLHHHCIVSVHPDTLERMESLVGENTLVKYKYSSKIMTSDIKKCESMRLLYSSKMLRKYPDFLSFPDKF